MNILLVEDDYLLGRSMARLLEKSGEHRVRLTHKAADIFKYCQGGVVDVVIMDVNLPGTFWQNEEVTGVDLSRRLKSEPDTSHIPVVLLSAHGMDADKGHLLADSLADFVCPKPISDADSFLALLYQLTAGRHLFQGFTASAS
ncbi:MAG: response regulator [Cyanobacteria bacterium J06627_28]